jgi:hypothetical protein
MAAIPMPVDTISAAVDRAYEARPKDMSRGGRLGAGTLGEECERRLWYGFRWAHEPEILEGRKLRLFETGHREEIRLLDYLRLIGCEVSTGDDGQIGVTAVAGHLGGYLDGEATGVPGAPVAVHVVECKTHNDKSFKALLKDGVEKAKPAHYAQMQTYMHLRGRNRALYIAVNKNDDALYTERVAYDPVFGAALMAKAERVVTAASPLPKLHDDPTSKAAWACRYCPARPQCHEKAFAPRSCRSCLHSTPLLDGVAAWHCARWDRTLGIAEQRAGCPAHRFIPQLVPGEQIDVDLERQAVTYLIGGAEWVDGE